MADPVRPLVAIAGAEALAALALTAVVAVLGAARSDAAGAGDRATVGIVLGADRQVPWG